MPCDYEILKNHVSAAHPELLEAFVEGWNNLSPQLRDRWRREGFMVPKKKVEPKGWSSWTATRMKDVMTPRTQDSSFNVPLSDFEERLAILFHNNMQHSGDLFGLPYMPPLENRQYYSRTGDELSSSERHAIAKDAATVIIHTELRKLLIKWKKDLEEHGLDALRNAYLAAPKLEEEDKFKFSDFDADVDCDSVSGI